jgi:DNA-binding beta-propeller fold protein YncE
MPTLLLYTLMTEPSPLQASPQSGNLTTAQLTIIATNDTAAGVPLQGIIVQFPVGDGQKQLTNRAIEIQPVPPPGWKLAGTQYPTDAVQYDFQPTGDGTVASQQSLSFTFNNVEVNRTPGTCEVVVTEGSNDCQPPVCPTKTIDVAKFPAGWGTVAFWAEPDMIPSDGSTTLKWAGPGGATYTIDYYTSATGPVHVPEPGQKNLSNQGQYPSLTAPPLQLAQTTTFYLTVVDRINNQRYEAQQQVTVTVEQPLPTIKSFIGQVEQVGGQNVLVLNWETTHADHCQLTGDPHLLAPNSTDNSYKIYATPGNPLLPAYTLTAINAVGQVAKQLRATAATYVAQPISGFQDSWLTRDVCALDNSRALALVDQSIIELAISSLTISVAKSGTTAFENPDALALLPDGTRFYVMPSFDETVQAFSATLEPIGMTPDISYLMTDLAASGGTHPRLYVAYSNLLFGGMVSIFDALTLQWVSAVTVGQPVDIVAAPAGDRLYVSCLDNTLWTLDLTIDPVSVLSTISVGNSPLGIGVSQDGTRVVVACGGDDTVWVLDAQNTPMTLIGAPVKVGNSPYAVAVAGHQAFVTNKGGGNISIIDITATPPVTVGTPLPIAGQPREIAVTKDGLWLLVVVYLNDQVGLTALVWQQFHYQAADTSA